MFRMALQHRKITVFAMAVGALQLWAGVAEAQRQAWITQFGTATTGTSGNDFAVGLAPAGGGDFFVAGSTAGDLGAPSAGADDVYVARYDRDGDRIWIRQFGSATIDNCADAASDGAGGVLVAGQTYGQLGAASFGGVDAFVARFDGAGNRLWVRQLGSSGEDSGRAVATDGAGGVFVAGNTLGDFVGNNKGYTDGFLARYDNEGELLWTTQFGTAGRENVWCVTHDGAGGAIVGGSVGTANASEWDAVLIRFDKDGNQRWKRTFGTPRQDMIYGLFFDGPGGVVVTGSTSGDLAGPNAGSGDVFIARFDLMGNEIWIRQFGTSASDTGFDLATDGAGGMILVGETDGGLGGPNAGAKDVFVARLDGDGNQSWIRQLGSPERDMVRAVVADGLGRTVLAGSTLGRLGGPNAGGYDAFIASYVIDSCYADCDPSTGIGVLDIFDFLCFQNSFVGSEPYACDCDTSTGNGVCDIFDFLCFQDAFVNGCP